MLVAYFDESGNQARSPAVGITGLIGEFDEWLLVVSRWRDRLMEDNIKIFHAWDCINNAKEFSDIFYWNGARKDLLFADLSKILGSHNLGSISAQASSALWSKLYSPNPSKEIAAEIIASQYAYCFGSAMNHAVEWSATFAAGVPVSLVFAEQPTYAKAAHGIVDFYLSMHDRSRKNIASVEFASPRKLVPLQAADFVSYFFYQMQDMIKNVQLVRRMPFLDGLIRGRPGQDFMSRTVNSTANYESVIMANIPQIRTRHRRVFGHILPLFDYNF